MDGKHGEQQGKGPSRPIDLLRESKWRNAKDDGAGIHTSAPRVPQPAPRTTPLAGGQPVSCRSISSEVVSFGVPALPVARRLSRPDITAYGLTTFGPGQQRRGFAQMPFQPLDNKTAAAMYNQLSPEGQSIASLANVAGNEAARNMELWNKQKFDSIDLGLKELTDEITVLGLTGLHAVAAATAVVWYVYLVIEETVVELSGKYSKMAAALLNGLLRSFFPWLHDIFVPKEESGENGKSEAPAKK